MTVLSTAKDRTEDAGRALHLNAGVLDIGPIVKDGTRVALTTTKEVAGHGVSLHGFNSTWHTQRTSRHDDDARVARHISHLVTAISAGQDMSAGDIHSGRAAYRTCRTEPFARIIGEVTRATTEHVAIERMAVITSGIGKLIVRLILISICCSLSIFPASTFSK